MDWKKLLIKGFKFLFIAGSFLFIANRLWNEYRSDIFLKELYNLNTSSIILFAGAMLLVFVNWFIEALKWKYLLVPLQKISIVNAIKSVLSGISVSIFTPNRVGEFGGRILFLEKEVRVQGIFATLVGNIAQTIVTLISGILFFPLFFRITNFSVAFNENLLFALVITIVILGLLFFFNMKIFVKKTLQLGWFSKKKHILNFLLCYSKTDLLICFCLSVFRYIVFTFQFFLLLHVFGIHLSYYLAMMAVSQVYFIMTFIPTFALAEFGIRGSVAILIIGFFSPLTSSIMAASLMLWVINLAIPALIGTFFIYKSNL